MRLCGWCVRAGGCASTCAVIPRIRGPLASFAAVVSGLFCICIFCVACCRALLDRPELRESFKRLCRRAAAFQLVARIHTTGMGGRLQVWLWRFQSCFTSAFFLSRAIVNYWINLGLVKRRASVRSRGCFPPCRAQSRQGLVGRVQLWRKRVQPRFALAALAARGAMCYRVRCRLRAYVCARVCNCALVLQPCFISHTIELGDALASLAGAVSVWRAVTWYRPRGAVLYCSIPKTVQARCE